MFKNGKELINTFEQVHDNKYWISDQLISFIRNNSFDNPYIDMHYDQVSNKVTYTLDGQFTKSELEALAIIAEHEEGTPRG
jgi:hypothetical protein